MLILAYNMDFSTKQCPCCQGEGHIEVHSEDYKDRFTELCPICTGSGQLNLGETSNGEENRQNKPKHADEADHTGPGIPAIRPK